MRVKTADQLFLFYDRAIPKFFVWIGEGDELASTLPVYDLRSSGYYEFPDRVHAWIHKTLGNVCRGEKNRKMRRSGRDSVFSNMIRRTICCFDTPLMDVDECDIHDGKITGVYEHKNLGERIDSIQVRVLDNLAKIMSVKRLGPGWV